MKVAFMVGPMSSSIIESMSKSVDNVEFFTYTSVEGMIRESTLRHVFFDRIIFSAKVLSEDIKGDLESLDGYVKEYSDNTSIVFLCKEGDYENCNIFNSIFNSPLYTPVMVGKMTTKVFLEFVKDEIQDLRSRYFSSDVEKVKTYTNKYVEEKPVEEVVEDKPAKKGFLSFLFGNKENKSKKVKSQNNSQEPLTTEGKAEEMVSNFSDDLGTRSDSSSEGFSIDSGTNSSTVKNDIEGNSKVSDYASGYDGTPNSVEEISSENSDSDDLGLGDFGKNHVDTGYLDDEEELLRDLALANEREEATEEDVVEDVYIEDEDEDITTGDSYSDDFNEEVYEEVATVVNEGEIRLSETSGLLLVAGHRGTNIASYVLSEAKKISSKGSKVLIVDLDYKENEILSLIDCNRFYREGLYCGINDKKVYYDGNISIASNGYGVSLNINSVVDFLESELYYDLMVLVCPFDCFDCISLDVLESFNVEIKMIGDRKSMISTVSALTGSSYEDILFEKSKFVVDKCSSYDDDLKYLRSNLLFGRGDWLSKF